MNKRLAQHSGARSIQAGALSWVIYRASVCDRSPTLTEIHHTFVTTERAVINTLLGHLQLLEEFGFERAVVLVSMPLVFRVQLSWRT